MYINYIYIIFYTTLIKLGGARVGGTAVSTLTSASISLSILIQQQLTVLHFDLYTIEAPLSNSPIIDVRKKLQKTSLNIYISNTDNNYPPPSIFQQSQQQR